MAKQETNIEYKPLLFVGVILLAIGGLDHLNLISLNFDVVTTYLGEKVEDVSSPIRIVVEKTKAVTAALFDVILTFPRDTINTGEKLPIKIQLINFGSEGNTDVDISYIVTSSHGDVVFIEHEERIVQTQDEFLKELQVTHLNAGEHKLFVEMLYSNTSATAAGTFYVE